jgi:hypothetical protein
MMFETRNSLVQVLVVASVLWCAAASAQGDREYSLDADKGVVLPSTAGEVFFQQRRKTLKLYEDQWEITSDDLHRVDGLLAKELKRNQTGEGLPHFPNYYRQYFPARKGNDRVVVVIGFSGTAAEWFPDKGIPRDQWKHKLEMAFGGGCSYWHAVYSTEQHRFLILSNDAIHHQAIVCNAPK